MKKTVTLLLLLSLVFGLCSCGKKPEPIPEVVPEPEFPEVIVEAPVEKPEPEPIPEVTYLPGMTVLVNGALLENGSIHVDGVLYVNVQDLADNLGTQWSAEQGLFWRGQWVELPVPTVPYRDGSYVPVRELCRELGLGMLQDGANMRLYVDSAAGVWEIPEGYHVPVIMYHGVTDDLWGMTDLLVRPADMEAHLQYLTDNGFTPIWFEDLARVDEIEKPVILTFDDGYADNYHELYPLLQKYQAKATIFVVTGTMDYNPRNMTSAQVQELSRSGLVSIQSHTVTHPYLASLTPEEQRWELEYSQLVLTRLTGRIPYVICYPSGDFDETTLELAKELYCMGVDMNGGDYRTGEDPYAVSRWYIARSHPVETFIAMVEWETTE